MSAPTGSGGSQISLRPYQQEAISAVLDARDRGVRRQLLVLPTGGGKTIVFAELIRRLRLEEGGDACAR